MGIGNIESPWTSHNDPYAFHKIQAYTGLNNLDPGANISSQTAFLTPPDRESAQSIYPILFFFLFLGLHLWHMEVPRLVFKTGIVVASLCHSHSYTHHRSAMLDP